MLFQYIWLHVLYLPKYTYVGAKTICDAFDNFSDPNMGAVSG